MSFHAQLVEATQAEREYLLGSPVIGDCLAGRVSRAQYIAFLAQAYHHVKHTVPLLMACGSRLPARLEWLRTAVAEYIDEEVGHQEWILADIGAAGGDAEAVRAGEPDLPAELMVAYAYDTIARRNPIGFFGMVQVLEGTSIQLASQAADVIARTLGLPDRAFSYLRSHGALDIDHVKFFATLMDRLDDLDDRAAVVHVARVMYRLYAAVFRALPSPGERRDAA